MNPNQNKKRGGARLQPGAKAAKPSGGKGRKATSPKKPKPKRTPAQQALHVLLIVATVLACLVIAAFIFLKIFVQKPPVVVQPTRNPQPGVTASQVPGQTPPPGVSSDRKEDFFTFMVVGRDTYGGGNTDTILLASYDVVNQNLSVMSIPRDTLVNVSWDIKKINSVYNVYGGGEAGMAALKQEIAELVGFQPDFTVTVEWEAVGELVDAIGGVYFDVPRRMYYNDLSQHFKIDLQKGYQKLNGDQAMQLLRYRHDSDDKGNILNSGYADGDLGRIKVQQAFLKATIEQCLKNITDINTISKLAQVFFDNVKTELTVGNLAYFAQMAILGNESGKRLNMDNVSFVTMPWVSANGVYSFSYKNYPSYVAPNADELVEVVNGHFNPYKDDLRKDELDIMYVNKDGTLGTTGGKLADGNYNSKIKNKGPAATSTPKPTETPEPTPSQSPLPSPSGSEPPAPSVTPSASAQPTPSPSGSQRPTPTPSGSPAQSEAPASPEPSATPTPTPTPTSTPEPTPTPGGSDVPEGIPVID